MEQLAKMNKQELEENQQRKIRTIFTAGWCPDCRFIKPAMPEIEEFSDLTLFKLIETKILIYVKNQMYMEFKLHCL